MRQPPDQFLRLHLARVVESSDDAIISKDLHSTILTWNPAAERLFGYTADEAIGRSIRMIIPPERQAEEDLVLSKIRAGEPVDHYETERQRKDGSRLTISLTVSPIRDDAGRIVGASKIARDISEQVRLRNEAREHARHAESVGRLGAAIASTLDRETIAQTVTDLATQVTTAEFGAFFYNVREPDQGEVYMLYALSGAPKEAFARFPHPRATALFAPTFRGEAVIRLDDVTQDPRYGRNEPFSGMPPGHLPVRSYLAVPVRGASRQVLGGLFFGHSRPGVFTAEQERFATGLASWAAVALENAHLYEQANRANRLKDEFLAMLSHELRTPLNAIVGYARLLRGKLLDAAKTASAVETIERNANALTQIVDDVLDVSSIVSGKLRLTVQPVDLATVLEHAVATVAPAADAKGVRVQPVLDAGVGTIAGDAARLQQVAWNLLANAVKFTPRGGRVQVRLEAVNSHVELTVSDTGIGIEPEFLPYVFERFRQADSTTTRKYGGLGLGLAIVRHIVEMHGGTVEARSDGAQRGASFVVRLPAMIVHGATLDAGREHPRVARRESERPFGALSGVRVTAVDDEVDALRLLRDVLEAAGADVTTWSTPREALDDVMARPPDVLLVDIGMPGMDGHALIRQVRAAQREDVRDVPAAALTAFARSEDRTRALESGFEMHLAKPIEPRELVATISRLVRRPRRSPQS
jgi:PAS domain S-box-containing protein